MKRLLFALLACPALACASSSGSGGPSLKDKPRPQSYFVGEAGRNWYMKGKGALGIVELATEVAGQVDIGGKVVTIVTQKVQFKNPQARIEQFSTMYLVEDGDTVKLYRQDSSAEGEIPSEKDLALSQTQLMVPAAPYAKKDYKPGEKWEVASNTLTIEKLADPAFFSPDRVAAIAADPSKAPPNAKKQSGTGKAEVVGAGKIKTPAGEFDTIKIRETMPSGPPGMQVFNYYAKGFGVVRTEMMMGAKPFMMIDLVEVDSDRATKFLGEWSGKQRLDRIKAAVGPSQ